MALKHLLNHDDSNEVYQNHHSFLSWSDHDPLSECIPTLPTQPWEQCVSEILGSQSLRYDMVQEEVETDLFESLEEANSLIKSWATGHPPCQTTVEDASQDQAYICYGTLVRSPIKLCGDMMVLSRKLNNCTLAPIQGHTQMVVTKIESQHVVAFSDGVVTGEVNAQLEKALCGIAEQGHELEFEVFAPVRAMLETIGRATKGKDAIIRVQINLYGPQNAASDIGKELSSHKLYLQDPGYLRDETIYDNPHILKLPGFDCFNAEVFPTQEGSACHKAPPEALETAMKDVYSSLTRDHNLQALEGDKRLQTCLLPHQGTALDFMKQRENGPIPPGYRLWELTEEAGVSCYRHVITNTLCMFEPEETGGGILADEMGMGKTLCVLALTLESLSVAQDWVAQTTATSNEPPEGWRCRPRCKATLIVASSDLMINEWFQELEKHFDRTTREALRTIKYHGTHRHVEAEILQEADIIVTTYHTLAADLNREKNTLKDMEWYRLVLDEAHIIRRQSTVLYRTVAEIAARSRWCLTGTPVQNRLEDIGSLFAFLRIQPFHSLSNFRKSIAIPFDEGGKRRSLSIQRFARLLDSCCLRRTKEVLHLPNEQHRVRVVHLSPEERAQYDRTHDMMFRAIRNQNAMFDQNSTLGMFQVQLQLRIICNHGTWQQPFSWNRRKLHLLDEREAMEASLGRNGEITCSGCREIMPLFNSGSMYRRFEEHCSHVLCIQCLGPSIQSDQESLPGRCPLCRPLWNASSQIPRSKHTSQEDTYFRADGCSSKMEALMRDISYDVWNTKSIIFTCWTRTLDLLEFYLRRLSSGTWIHERIDGECSTGKRERILRQFTNNPNLRVLIITTGTGAVGLNLATANRIFIFEPQWNPSVENQAVARALRLGQKQAVLVTRYVVEDTVEQTMRKLQDTKLQRANLVQSG